MYFQTMIHQGTINNCFENLYQISDKEKFKTILYKNAHT
jgi:hypothetical protein